MFSNEEMEGRIKDLAGFWTPDWKQWRTGNRDDMLFAFLPEIEAYEDFIRRATPIKKK